MPSNGTGPEENTSTAAQGHYDYVFGYGSIINTETHGPWLKNLDQEHSFAFLPGRRARLRGSFGYERGWTFRSTTGFTALGLTRKSSTACPINGVLFRIPHTALQDFDRREVGYDRVEIALEDLDLFVGNADGDAAAGGMDIADTQSEVSSPISTSKDVPFGISPNEKIWVYVPQNSQEANEDHPILQSYVDTVLQGCLEWGGENMIREFVETTGAWSRYFLNDTPSSRRPWLYRREYDTIDKILREFEDKTFYAERRHPEEFASAFLIRMMRGTWSLPKRNSVFTGRDSEISLMHSRLSASTSPTNSDRNKELRTCISILEIVGMGGVGKSQICTEYCYRYFSNYYGLIIWLNAQSAESISSGFRQLIADTTGTNVKDMDTGEVVTEVKARLFRSIVPWLLVFDNLEDRSLLDKFIPHGGSRGHVLVTTRLVGSNDIADRDQTSIMTLGCFNPTESVELLRRSAGAQNVRNDERHIAASQQLADHLGHLPLALGMAAAYMRQCDVDCIEYLSRYSEYESTGGAANSLGVQAVKASLSLSLNAMAKENPVALDALCLLCWLAPDQITKPLMRSLFQGRKQLLSEMVLEEEAALKLSTLKKCSIVGYGAMASSALLLASMFRLKVSPQLSSLVLFLLATAAAAATTTALLAPPVFQPSRPGIGPIQDVSSRRGLSFSHRLSFSADEFELTDQIWTLLKSFSLLGVKDGKGTMHRLLGQALRASQDTKARCMNLKVCIRVIQQVWIFKPEAVETWQKSANLLEHLKSVVYFASKERCCGLRLETSILARQGGIFSAMALNRFEEAQRSLEQSLEILDALEKSGDEVEQARGASLQELGRVYRYQGDFASSEKALRRALEIRERIANGNSLGRRESTLRRALDMRRQVAHEDQWAQREVAATLHELGVLEIKKHSLDAAAAFLQKALSLRRSLDNDLELRDTEAECASTLHQLAAVHVARKPPTLDIAETLLQEALGLRMQIGARAATLKQLARVAIRRGVFDKADRCLTQALELYVELYGETLHINVAAVKFQQGALAFQRDELDQAWQHFSEALQARRHVYAYCNGHHLEVSVVLHELGCVAFAQGRVAKSEEMLTNEKEILDQLYETSSQRHRIIQARLTNLTWLTKCAKATGNDEALKRITTERTVLKQSLRSNKSEHSSTDKQTRNLQQEALLCRLLARNFALTRKTGAEVKTELVSALSNLEWVESQSPSTSLKHAVHRFREIVQHSITSGISNGREILQACDQLRDALREAGVEVNDAALSKPS